jgi:hypothetical protein
MFLIEDFPFSLLFMLIGVIIGLLYALIMVRTNNRMTSKPIPGIFNKREDEKIMPRKKDPCTGKLFTIDLCEKCPKKEKCKYYPIFKHYNDLSEKKAQ